MLLTIASQPLLRQQLLHFSVGIFTILDDSFPLRSKTQHVIICRFCGPQMASAASRASPVARTALPGALAPGCSSTWFSPKFRNI